MDTVEGLRDAARRPELAARRGLGHRREIKLGSAVTQLGQLDTFTSIAERLGLKVDIEHLSVLLDEGIPVAFSEVEVGAAWGNPRPPASDRFFAAYQELNPSPPGWAERMPVLHLRELLSSIAHFGSAASYDLGRVRDTLGPFYQH